MLATEELSILRALAAGRLPDCLPDDAAIAPELLALVEQLRDMQQLALALGRGDLEPQDTVRSRGPLVGSLKALHAALRHLSWQAQRVAEGDLSHRVDFMGDFAAAFNEMVRQLAERQNIEEQLRQALKHEAVGRLAGGVAHEINTPAQFASGDIQFLADAFPPLLALVADYRRAVAELPAEALPAETRAQLADAEQAADLDFLGTQVPEAVNSALEGIARIAKIVSALKEFAAPDLRDKSLVDINRALSATLTVSESHVRGVASVETDFAELPPVLCRAAEINEVFFVLISNAVHAIEDAGRSGQGRIVIRTSSDGDDVRVEVADNGCGIDPAIAGRLFDPFFTTKAVGRGSGQGLALAHSVVVSGHGGRLEFESRPGEGSCFRVTLPVKGDSMPSS